jgi:hypothetical protein
MRPPEIYRSTRFRASAIVARAPPAVLAEQLCEPRMRVHAAAS